jgi:glycosyltransferase involved in cell wall biosynthesis
MNLGIQAASGEYVFRFDDDDHYGENYATDNMLYAKCMDYAIGGKVFKYFTYHNGKKGVRVFDRKRSSLEFRRPAALSLDTFDAEFTPFSGATQGGRKATFVEHAFPHSVFGAADTALLDVIMAKRANLTGVIFDDLNFVVERRANADHTWKVSEKILLSGVTDIGDSVAPVMADDCNSSLHVQQSADTDNDAEAALDRRLRVLFISPRVLGLLGSPGSYSLVEALAKLVSLRVICNTDQSGSKDVPQVHQVSPDINVDYLSFRDKESTNDILDIIGHFRPHVVHVVNYHGWVDLVPKIRQTFPGVRCVMDIKTPLLQEGPLRGQLQQKGCTASEHVDAFLAYSKENVETWLACNHAPVLVYPLGIDAGGIVPRSLGGESIRRCRKFVYIGNLHEKRRLVKLVSLIRALPPELLQRFSLDIFGSGNGKDRLAAQIQAEGLGGIVRVHDVMPQAELFSTLKNYDAGIAWVPLETYDNAPSLKFLEYAAAGLVTVATATSGHQRNVDAGFKTFLFSETPDSFAQVIRQLMEEGVDGATIWENAELVKLYDWENIAREYIIPYYGIDPERSADVPWMDIKRLKSVYTDSGSSQFLLNLSAREAMHAHDVSKYEFR